MIPGYHIDHNHGFVKQAHIFDKKMVYDRAYIKERYEKYTTVDQMNVLRLDLIKDHCGRPDTIYDFGYGNGSFLTHCYHDGIKPCGYEVNTWPLPDGCMHALPDPLMKFDVVTLFDVFEHLTEDEQRQILGVVCRYMVLSVPWCHWHELGDGWFMDWRHRRADEHLSHFTPASLCSLFRLYNYRPIFVGNPEDQIRKVETEWWPNILTVIFKRV